jgi:hypothetical protein
VRPDVLNADYLAEAAASIAGSGRFRFPTPTLPAMPRLLPRLVWIRTRTARADRIAVDEALSRLMEAAIGTFNGKFRDVFGMSPTVYRKRERTT